MLELITTTALTEPLPVPKPPGPGGSCPHGYIASGSFCTPSPDASDAIAKPSNDTCSGDALRRARTACEMDARGPSLRPSPCRVASRRVVLTSARPSRAASQEGAWPRKRLEAMWWGSRPTPARRAGIRDELRNCSGRCRTFRAWAISSRITRPAIGKGVGRPAAGSIQNN
jgi:hypothetical protein